MTPKERKIYDLLLTTLQATLEPIKASHHDMVERNDQLAATILFDLRQQVESALDLAGERSHDAK